MDLFLDGLGFCEAPRWHGGRLWFSDFITNQVLSADPAGELRVEAELDDRPSGLGWLPDGRLLVVSMRRRQIVRREADGRLAVHADLTGVATANTNDMVVAATGIAYVGNFGSDVVAGEPLRAATLALVDPDGTVTAGPRDLQFPNGSVISADGSTLIVGESFANRFRSFGIHADGTLGDGRLWADLGERSPDGCTLDAEGAIWFAHPRGKAVARVFEGGRVGEVHDLPDNTYACALGGDDGRTLFALTCPNVPNDDLAVGTARVWATEVDVPHAGLP